MQKPLEYTVQRMFRTARPSPGDALKFLSKNIITPMRDVLGRVWDAISGAFSSVLRSVMEFFSALPGEFERGGIEAVVARLLPVAAAGFGIALALDLASVKVVGYGLGEEVY